MSATCVVCGRGFGDDNALYQHTRAAHPKVKAARPPRASRDSDMVELFKDLRDFRARRRARFGIPCPRCIDEQPQRQPTILEPGQRCRVHRPAYTDPRSELTQQEIDTL